MPTVKMKLTAEERKQGRDLRDYMVVPIKGAANRRRMGGAAMLVRKPEVKGREVGKPDRRQKTRRLRDKTTHKPRGGKPVAKVGSTNLFKYEVTIVREIEHRAVIEVEAESADVAKQMAYTIADNGNPYSNHWVEGDTISDTAKVRKL